VNALVKQEVQEVAVPGALAPEVGSLVDYGLDSWRKEPGKYRVEGYMCPAEPLEGDDIVSRIMREILEEEASERRQKGLPPARKPMRWCHRHEATHVSLYGISGTLAPIGEVKVTGHLRGSWTDEMVADLQRQAEWLVEHGRQ
jgi:hypothetical protein